MTWNTAPEEVKEYFNAGPHKAISVVAESPYNVVVTFDDGMRKRYDYTGKFTGVLSILNDPELFQHVYLDDSSSISWDTPNGHMDFSADTVYIYGQPVNTLQ